MININDNGFLELSGINQHSHKEQLSAANFPILEGLSPLNLRVLNQASKAMNVAKGVGMMLAGDTPHDLYFIRQGSIAVAKDHEGKVQVVAKLREGDFYGEYGVLRGRTRFASVYTAEKSLIICVDLNAVQQVIEADANFKSCILGVMQQRVLNSFLFNYTAFQNYTTFQRGQLSKTLIIRELNRDDSLFEQSDLADKYYIVLSGEAEIFVQAGGKEILLEIRRDNGVLGEVRTDKGEKYGYSVRAANQLDLLVLDKAGMQALQQVNPESVQVLNTIMSIQAKKTIAAMKQLEN